MFVILLNFMFWTLVATASSLKRTSTSTITANDILKLAPTTSSCTGAPYPSECRTAEQAAPYIAVSFLNFNISSFGVQAALVALMLYESGSFAYNQNHLPAPGAPGQGTRNMQSPAFTLEYAQWLADTVSNSGISAQEVSAARAKGPAEVLALMQGDMWSFGSAAWFLATQCDGSVMEGLAAGTQEGWETYLTTCVGTAAVDARTVLWRQVISMGKW